MPVFVCTKAHVSATQRLYEPGEIVKAAESPGKYFKAVAKDYGSMSYADIYNLAKLKAEEAGISLDSRKREDLIDLLESLE